MKRRGALIVLEGLDRSGKTTQAALLVEALRRANVAVEARRFPDRSTVTGVLIEEYLGGTDMDARAAHLLFSANRWEARDAMEAAMAAGTTLVVDRYTDSGAAFSMAKGLDEEWCRAPDVGLPQPDLVLFMDVSAEEAARRAGYGGERYEREAFQQLVYEAYGRLRDPERWVTVAANGSPLAIHAEILPLLQRVL